MVYCPSAWSLNSEAAESSENACDAILPEQHSMVVPSGTRVSVRPDESTPSVSDVLVNALAEMGVTRGFGIIGGGIAPFCEALDRSRIQLVHFRQEVGAAFAAIEASLASGQPTLVFATTGPGLTNMFTGMVAARREGAKVIFVTGCTSAAHRGRGAFQETSLLMGDMSSLFTPGTLFHHAAMLEDVSELATSLSRLESGLARRQGFVAHLGLPMSTQTARLGRTKAARVHTIPPSLCDQNTLDDCISLLCRESFVIWLGFGARHCAAEIRVLAERTGARVMCSPRAKGIFPEDSPLFLGVTGLGGHEAVIKQLRKRRPDRILVLGTRMGEFSSFWLPELTPTQGFIHVDLESDAFGTSYPDVPTLGVQAEIGAFVRALNTQWPSTNNQSHIPTSTTSEPPHLPTRLASPVRPSFLMGQIQREIVERSNVILLTEAGNSFALGSHYLRFRQAGRYRVSSGFGSMGHATAGVIGAAMGSATKAVAIVGDGAMLMLNEMSTAANYGIDAVWIVLNDARYGMIAQGMRSIGWQPFSTDFPRVDFAAIARAMGADGVRVERESQVESALRQAMVVRGPFVVDVIVDPNETAPANRRNASLVQQGIVGATGKHGSPEQ